MCARFVEELKQKSGKNIWICGGAEVAQQLISNNLIDTYHLGCHSGYLGGGISLFGGFTRKIDIDFG